MKTPVGLVTAALAVAILLAVSFLIATGTRGEPPAFGSSAGELEVRTVARGLVNPWALAFLPDGRMLVTERPGRMRIVTSEGQVSPPLKGVPEVWASGQGGLLDVAADKSYAQNKTYFCLPSGPTAVDAPRSRAPNSTTARAGSTTSRSSSASRGRCHREIITAAASRRPMTAICSSRWASTTPSAIRRKVSTIISAR